MSTIADAIKEGRDVVKAARDLAQTVREARRDHEVTKIERDKIKLALAEVLEESGDLIGKETVAPAVRGLRASATPDLSHEELARAAYAAYGDTTGGKNYQGLPMPAFAELTPTIRAAWVSAALRVRLLVLEGA